MELNQIQNASFSASTIVLLQEYRLWRNTCTPPKNTNHMPAAATTTGRHHQQPPPGEKLVNLVSIISSSFY